ncbi:hypothetical protein T492DRAFT_848482 [Pavlovales sp. CCMP2436]|nr:hypothetical protein T492DRAFT_848482 [Pavlovales sp. CCMP2436]
MLIRTLTNNNKGEFGRARWAAYGLLAAAAAAHGGLIAHAHAHTPSRALLRALQALSLVLLGAGAVAGEAIGRQTAGEARLRAAGHLQAVATLALGAGFACVETGQLRNIAIIIIIE